MVRGYRFVVLMMLLGTGLSVCREAATAAGAPPRQQAPESLRELVAGLGDAHWFRRESAHRELLDVGMPAVPYLEQVVGSPNLELSYRAQDLLNRIAPQVVDFHLLSIDLGSPLTPTPRLAGTAAITLPPGHEVSLRLTPVPRPSLPHWETRPFAISYNRTLEGRLDIQIAEITAGPSGNRVDLYRPLTGTSTISLVKRSEVSTFRTRGMTLERSRERFLLVLRAEYRRETSTPRQAFPEHPDAAYEQLLAQLRTQATTGAPDERLMALQLLSELRAPDSGDTFQQALASSQFRQVAALAVGNAKEWNEILRSPDAQSSPGGTSSSRKRSNLSVSLQAAARLAAIGDKEGYHYLAGQLLNETTYNVHFAMSTLSDVILARPVPPEVRTALFDIVVTDEFLGRTIWQDQEIEHFLSTLLEKLDPDDTADVARARQLQEAFERLAVGDLGPAVASFSLAFDLWRRAQAKLSPSKSAEAEFALRLIPQLSAKNSLNQAQSRLQRVLIGHLDEGTITLDAVLTAFRQQFAAGPKPAADALNLFLNIARKVRPTPESIRSLVETLVEGARILSESPLKGSGMTSKLSLLRRVANQLAQWIPPEKGRPTRKRSPQGQFDPAWQKWLDDEAAVTACQEKLRSEIKAPEGDKRNLYYFLLQLNEPGKRTAESTAKPGAPRVVSPPRLGVLEGRLFETSKGSLRFIDSQGTPQQLRLVTNATPGRKTTYRLETGNSTATVQLEQPHLRSLPRPSFAPRVYENSDLLMGSRYLSSLTKTRYSLLVMVSTGPPPPPASTDEPEKLWRWFLDNKLLQLPADTPAHTADQTIRVLTTLGIKETLPLLRQVFDKRPSPTRARQLYELGDERGLDFLKQQLAEERATTRRTAARLLCELGIPEGATTLLAVLSTIPDARNGQQKISYSDLRALELYLAKASEAAAERSSIFEFFLLQIEEANWQHTIFRAIEQESKTDFGYRAARVLNDEAERKVAVARSVKAAREWWTHRREAETPAPAEAADPPK